jgi:hypothetical protein
VEDHKVLKYTHVFGKMPHTAKKIPLGLFKDNASAYFGQMRTFMYNVKDNYNAQKHNVSTHEAKMWSLRGV